MHLNKIRRAGFDTETTGPDPQEARIVTTALVVRGGGRADQTYNWLISPGVPIPDEATAIHGITTEKAEAEGQDPKVALEEIADRLAAALNYGMPVIAFNLSFDWTVLDRDLRRNGLAPMGERLTTEWPALVDPHVIDKHVDRYRKGSGRRKLQPTADVYGIEVTGWHTADADAVAALSIAEAQFQQFPWLSALGTAGLYGAQQAWRAEQQAGLQEWFRTKATPEQGGAPDKVIDRSWPLLPLPAGVAS
ncbi:exonuclease domain-containing protein [Kitasatospora sp. NPDC048239]|uniref:exonuclease domain-containing protein n=1 Tax=Kitasatospora sp. NPDC048239 TaxID=3364046 RepID=UPI0037165C60